PAHVYLSYPLLPPLPQATLSPYTTLFRSEIEIPGFDADGDPSENKNAIRAALGTPTPDRLRMVAQALRLGTSQEDVHAMCQIDPDRKSTRLNSSHVKISYAVFCLKKKNIT